MQTIVVDANIMASALLGRSFPLLTDIASRAYLVAPVAQFVEVRKVLAREAIDDPEFGIARLAEVVDSLEPDLFSPFEERARERLGPRGQPDWPVLAAALALGGTIWSRDPDLFGTGVGVWSTRNIVYAA